MAMEGELPNGLIVGHAYSVTDARNVCISFHSFYLCWKSIDEVTWAIKTKCATNLQFILPSCSLCTSPLPTTLFKTNVHVINAVCMYIPLTQLYHLHSVLHCSAMDAFLATGVEWRFGRINKVTLYRASIVQRWVTIGGYTKTLGPTQPSTFHGMRNEY